MALEHLDKKVLERVKLHFWGDKKIEERISIRADLRDRIQTHAFRPHQEFIAEFVAQIGAAFLSLHGDYYSYALPSKIFEYINLEKPVLASGPEGGLKRFVEENAIGYFSHYKSASELASNITRLVKHKGRLSEFGKNVQRIKPNFSTELQTRKLSELLEKRFFTKDEICAESSASLTTQVV